MRLAFWRKAPQGSVVWSASAPPRQQFVWAPLPAGAVAQGIAGLSEMPHSASLPLSRWLARIGALRLPWTLFGLGAVAAVAVASRLRYVASFDGVYGSGDANLILARALFMKDGWWTPPENLAITHNLFDQPPLIPALLAAVSQVTGLSLALTPLVVMPIVTTLALTVLTRLLARAYGWPVALAAACLIALLPRLSLDSTEPEKAPFVVSLFILALAALYAGMNDRRFLLLSGLCIGLAMLAHTTGYLFLPVLVLSYSALHARSPRGAWNRYALAALAFPLASVVVYFSLARYFGGPQAATATSGSSDSVLPGFVQIYVDAFVNLSRGGFADSAFDLYIRGIRAQLGTPIFALALGGFLLGLYEVALERKWHRAGFLLWAFIITVAFAIQYPASSHGSRYPSYVTPVYIVLAVSFVVSLAERISANRRRLVRAVAVAPAAALIAYAGVTYAAAPNPGLRDLYASHDAAADYVTGHRLLDNGDGALYLGWPSITFSMVESRPDYADRLFTFGFGSRDLTEFTPAYLGEHRIRYYLYDHTGNDYYGSADTVRDMLVRTMVVEELANFTGRPGSYTTLYRLRPRAVISPERLPAMYAAARVWSSRNLGFQNGDLCYGSDGMRSGWQENGVVTVESQASQPNGCGVIVTNQKEWGGIRQQMTASAPGQPFTTVAAVRAFGPHPAKRALVAVFVGSTEVGETLAELHSGTNYLLLQGFTPLSGQAIRLVVASGPGDDGDLAIDGVVIADGFPGDE